MSFIRIKYKEEGYGEGKVVSQQPRFSLFVKSF